MIETYAVAYAPSVTVLAETRRRRTDRGRSTADALDADVRPTLLAFGNPALAAPVSGTSRADRNASRARRPPPSEKSTRSGSCTARPGVASIREPRLARTASRWRRDAIPFFMSPRTAFSTMPARCIRTCCSRHHHRQAEMTASCRPGRLRACSLARVWSFCPDAKPPAAAWRLAKA